VTKKITIALDCMGGDKSPDIVVKGACIVARKNKKIHFIFYGDLDLVNPLLEKYSILKNRYSLVHTTQNISNEDKPSIALRRGTKSSMRLAINSLKEGQSDAVVSAGNTGALMAISKVVLRLLATIDRPAIVTFIPNKKKTATVMLDMGANIECNSDVLYQFAIMGHAFAKTVLKIPNPTIGLLNVGSEDLKGSDAVKNAAILIKESDISSSFYGYVEGDDICKGTVDVVVTDGFSGNITLKAIEGTAKMISQFLKDGFNSSLLAKIGYLLTRKSLKNIFKRIDPRVYNGAMLIGLNGVVVKSHGGTDEIGFANAINVAVSLVEDKINNTIIKEVKSSGLDIDD
jgi:glycerol-3-phosphate acyltransferase PlsX